jgi:SpoIID/LytB domain protein
MNKRDRVRMRGRVSTLRTRTRPTYHRPSPLPGARRARHGVGGLHGLLALGCSIAALALGAPAAEAWQLVVEGAGDGHGVGMSQDGALGLAEHGYSDTQILAHYYPGTAIGAASADAVVRVEVGSKVLRVPLERYVRGVVSAEMPASWPAAALQAQAIASRTYALTAHAGGSRFDVYADTRSQVYRGATAETPATNAAVAATAGQVVTYAGVPAITYFFASSGGETENVENAFAAAEPEPWLKGVPDPYEGRSSKWNFTLSSATAAARLRGLVKGSLRGIEVLRRGVSPRILLAEVLGSRGATQLSGAELAYRLGLPSTWGYFSLKSGSTLTREPDLSGRGAPPADPSTGAVPLRSPTPPAAAGGSQAPAGSSPASAGGTSAS